MTRGVFWEKFAKNARLSDGQENPAIGGNTLAAARY
jgi:hypothetical protein